MFWRKPVGDRVDVAALQREVDALRSENSMLRVGLANAKPGKWYDIVNPIAERLDIATKFKQNYVFNTAGAEALAALMRDMARLLDQESDCRWMIEQLRDNEGAGVTILCNNPEAWDAEQTTGVEVVDWWTQWEPKRYLGPTIVAALRKALADKLAAEAGQ